MADPGFGGGGHNGRCGYRLGRVVGGAPGRVREGGTPPAQLGGMGERCKLPHPIAFITMRFIFKLNVHNIKRYIYCDYFLLHHPRGMQASFGAAVYLQTRQTDTQVLHKALLLPIKLPQTVTAQCLWGVCKRNL